jgi:hypothetical protein
MVYDQAYDSSRHRVYLSQPDQDRVAVLSLDTLAFTAPIQLFGYPQGLDLSVSGDSLAVVLRTTPVLAVVHLTTGQVDTLQLDMASGLNPGPVNVRVMGNDKAFVTIAFAASTGGELLEYDLGTGAQRLRPDVVISNVAPLARAGDRSRLLLIEDNACCPEQGDVYLTATDTFAIRQPTVDRFGPKISADRSGAHFLIGESLFDGALNLLRTYSSTTTLTGNNAIAEDGLSVYLSVDGGYLKQSAADGALLETVRVGLSFDRLVALPGGQWLMGFFGDPSHFQANPRIVLIDLR